MSGGRRQRPLAVILAGLLLLGLVSGGCGGNTAGSAPGPAERPRVVVDTTFLADIVRNVAGDLFDVVSLVPQGVDPHAFEPSPRDAAAIAEADALVLTYVGLEPGIAELLRTVSEQGTPVIDVSSGFPDVASDPHLWLDPRSVIGYVSNIEKGLVGVRPGAEARLKANAEEYVRRLEDLDEWIREQVALIPQGKRLLVTEHESLGRFAARYGFQVVGTLLPGQSTEGAPSAERLAALVTAIKNTGAKAVFLETGSPEDLAQQVAQETGVQVVADLHTHSLSEETPSYLEMMRWNVERIIAALR